MSKNLWVAGVLLVMLALVVGLGGCERAKPSPTATPTSVS
jgi:hypothetical protein